MEAGRQMGMLQYLEEDKEQLQAAIVRAGTPERVQTVVEKEWDRLLFRYNEECRDDHLKSAALYMMQTAKMIIPVITSASETRIWESEGNAFRTSESKRRPVLTVAALITGVVLICGSLLAECIAGNGIVSVPVFLKSILAALIGCVLLFLAGRLSAGRSRADTAGGSRSRADTAGGSRSRTNTADGSGSSGDAARRVEILVDPDRVWACLKATVLTVDRNLEDVRQQAEYETGMRSTSDGNGISREEADLYSGLLELAYGQRTQSGGEKSASVRGAGNRYKNIIASGNPEGAEIADEMISSLKYYLHRREVEVVDYEDSRRGWFELLPGTISATIRPALVMGGELISKGLAAYAM